MTGFILGVGLSAGAVYAVLHWKPGWLLRFMPPGAQPIPPPAAPK
jgi:hypothetical protein